MNLFLRSLMVFALVGMVFCDDDKAEEETKNKKKEIEGPVIGIDLGTTYSCVGIFKNGRVEIIPNELGNRITPSQVAFTDEEKLVGEAAKNQGAQNPLRTIYVVKRLIGRKHADQSVQSDIKLWPFKVESGAEDKPMIVVQYKGETKKF